MFGSLEFIIVIAVARLLSVSSRGRFNRLARSRDIPQASTPQATIVEPQFRPLS